MIVLSLIVYFTLKNLIFCMDFWSFICLGIFIGWFINIYNKNIGNNYKIYDLIIVKIVKKSLMLNYGLSITTFETCNHASTQLNIL